MIVEVITYANEIESKGVQFPGRDTPDKSVGAIGSRPRHLENLCLCTTGTPRLGCVRTKAIISKLTVLIVT